MNSRTTEPMRPSAPDVIGQPVALPVVACSEFVLRGVNNPIRVLRKRLKAATKTLKRTNKSMRELRMILQRTLNILNGIE